MSAPASAALATPKDEILDESEHEKDMMALAEYMPGAETVKAYRPLFRLTPVVLGAGSIYIIWTATKRYGFLGFGAAFLVVKFADAIDRISQYYGYSVRLRALDLKNAIVRQNKE